MIDYPSSYEEYLTKYNANIRGMIEADLTRRLRYQGINLKPKEAIEFVIALHNEEKAKGQTVVMPPRPQWNCIHLSDTCVVTVGSNTSNGVCPLCQNSPN